MPKFKPIKFDKFKELIDLIPLIQEAVFKGLERDLNLYDFNYSQLEVKIKLFKQIFAIIQKKWAIDICFSLLIYNECSFNELRRSLNGVSTRILTDRLVMLQQQKIIIREVISQKPLRVKYYLSDFGKEEVILFIPVLLNYLLPRKKKKGPGINEIQAAVKASINPELVKDQDQDEESSKKISQKIT
jgi:DNA-binding HxlR family transcriptional regulator